MNAPARVEYETLADLLRKLGGIPLERVRLHPPPGTARDQDVVEAEAHENRLFELIDGTLVEKAMGFRESLLAVALSGCLRTFVKANKLGVVTGSDGMMRLFPGMIRIPDVAFISWGRLPNGKVPSEPVPNIVPDLAVEVLSESNTPEEMARKRREYFDAGVKAVWEFDLNARAATIFLPDGSVRKVASQEVLRGEPVLPGFSVTMAELFAELDNQG